jgi:hypothetical protein
MSEQTITADMRVSQMLKRHPETVEVFLRHGCPNMRNGIFVLMARIMKVRWAARVHKIPLDELLADLNAAIKPRP